MLTKSQEQAFNLVKSWIDSKGKLFKLGGPAGSGKSFLIPELGELVGLDKCLLMTPTGKAATNLQKAGLHAQTIHSTIYKVNASDVADDESQDEDSWDEVEPAVIADYDGSEPEFILKSPEDLDEYELFIVDEGSMVGSRLLKDILSFDKPTLIVGDPNQLAPVNDLSIYRHCDFYLEEIVRQAADSPIIWLSQRALDGHLSPGVYGSCMVRKGEPVDSELMYADVVLANTNNRRTELNTHIRELVLGPDTNVWIAENDRVICRTNAPIFSDMGYSLTNGAQGVVTEIKHRNTIKAEFSMSNLDLGTYSFIGTNSPLKFPPKKRPPTVELGYALTVHLSQGSEWSNVIYDASGILSRRALYTAITRAKQSLLITL